MSTSTSPASSSRGEANTAAGEGARGAAGAAAGAARGADTDTRDVGGASRNAAAEMRNEGAEVRNAGAEMRDAGADTGEAGRTAHPRGAVVWRAAVECAAIVALWLVCGALPGGWRSGGPGTLLAAAGPVAVWSLLRGLLGGDVPARWRAMAGLGVGLSVALPVVWLPRYVPAAPPVVLFYGVVLAAAAMLYAPRAWGLTRGMAGEGRAGPGARRATWAAGCTVVALLGSAGWVALICQQSVASTTDWARLGWLVVRDGLRLVQAAGLGVLIALGAGPGIAAGARLLRRLGRCRALWVVGPAVVVSVGGSAAISWFVLGGIPHVQDEIAIVFQAKNFAEGRLWAPVPPVPEAFDMEFVLQREGRWYGKYFAGSSAILVPGIWAGAPWLVYPLLSGVAVVVLYGVARRLAGEGVARAAVWLAVISPWWLLTYASMMSHGGCLLLVLVAVWAWLRAAGVGGGRPKRTWVWGLAAGLAWGGAWHFRPFTALVAGVVLLGIVVASGSWRRVGAGGWLAGGAGAAVMFALFGLYNYALTGNALVAPFEQWSATDRLGFGADKGLEYLGEDGPPGHSAKRALENLRLNLLALMETLVGWPGAVLLSVWGLVWWRRGVAWGVALLPLALMAGYSAYYHNGTVYGPRYWTASLGSWVLLAAWGVAGLRRVVAGMLGALGCGVSRVVAAAGTGVFALVATSAGAVSVWPVIVQDYADALWNVDQRVAGLVRGWRGGPALVLMETPHYRHVGLRMDRYGSGFVMNSPLLDDVVIFARDPGPEGRERLREAFPQRRLYRLVDLGPDGYRIEPVADATAGDDGGPSQR